MNFLNLGNKTKDKMSDIGSASDGLAHKLFSDVVVDQRSKKHPNRPFTVTSKELSELSQERTPQALAKLLEAFMAANPTSELDTVDAEDPDKMRQVMAYLETLVKDLREEKVSKENDQSKVAELAAMALTTVVLRSSPELGITSVQTDIEHRMQTFGSNAIKEKKMTPFWMLCWEAVQDFVLIMLICLGVVGIVVETTIGVEKGETCGACWLEGFAILCSVCIVVLVTAGIDHSKQIAFKRLSKNLNDSNTKSVIRDGEVVMVVDGEIVVGDILSVNSHSMASIPADCVLLGPSMNLKMDESTLTGESQHVSKNAGNVILSGTTAVQGSGKMVVIAVGTSSVSGKIKAQIYESGDNEGGDALEGDTISPLQAKLEVIATQIGYAGIVAAAFSFIISCIIGLIFNKESAKILIEYFMLSVTVLAVAVPEGLPLAVTLALAFSSLKMTEEQNLVKHLDACETMGCTTTICTDKTGTLTTNKMTARAIFTSQSNFICEDPAVTLGAFIRNSSKYANHEMIAKIISICTMDETALIIEGEKVTGSSGNPTEVALLHLVQDLGENYREIRDLTRGRSDTGVLGGYLHEGKQMTFSSARKMMSWAVPLASGGYRIYSKGASEVILDRCKSELSQDGKSQPFGKDDKQPLVNVGEQYARRGMRCLGLAYRDLPSGTDFDARSTTVKNSDGSKAFEVETELIFCALVGIEDPLRSEVPGAIGCCYEAGIDVRLVTGDSPNTAVSIAYQAGILRDSHFIQGDEMVAANLKPNVLMEGKDFRQKVHRIVEGTKEFDQSSFDSIWPHLRVLARSSPEDKLTLAHGLNQSTLFNRDQECETLLMQDGIKIFPDRQVIAMTGDGTNDAPALKRADIGFAMGVAGTQIAKDAADIILLDDNFASIVTAAKWGRNVYASIQKFLQFQLTVNIAAVVTALVGAIVHQKSPLAAIQLLWVNLLMDSLASLALASEPPTNELLTRPPVNRSDSMITRQMWFNMLGQASYQIIVTMLLYFLGPRWFGFNYGHKDEEDDINSVHYTFIFNAFVWMQLFNEVNSRNLKGEVNVFKGIHKNTLFIAILLITSVLQVIIVEFGGTALHVSSGGLPGKYWGYSLAFGFGALPVQQIINVLFRFLQPM